MAAIMDTSMPQHDDLHLMGMQELDSTLSIFESSNTGRDPSTPATSTFEYSIDNPDLSAHTIVVDVPTEKYTTIESSEVHDGPKFHTSRLVLQQCGHTSQVALSILRTIFDYKSNEHVGVK